jgi:hypothetical protein
MLRSTAGRITLSRYWQPVPSGQCKIARERNLEMKWMLHDQKKKELVFRMEEHEIFDGMNYLLNLIPPKNPDAKLPTNVIVVGPSMVDSNWELKFKLPDSMPAPLDFFVNGHHPMKGDCVVASGFSIGPGISCHQAMTKVV